MGKKVLLLDDDATMRNVLKTLLELDGFQVNVCGDQIDEHIVDWMAEKEPEVILLDYHLKGISGAQILVKIREHPQLKDVRVVMASGMDHREECLRKGANAFILKPYMPDELIELLRQ